MQDKNHTLDFTIKKNKYLDSSTIRKEAMMRSIHKSVKINDVSMIIGKNDTNTRIQTEDADLAEKLEVQQTMIQLRKQCDISKTQSQQKELEIQQLRKEMQKLQIKEQQIQDQSKLIKDKTESAKLEFIDSKQKYEDSVQLEKSYAHVLARMQKDFLFNKDKLQQFERKLHKKSIEKDQALLHSFQTNQLNEQTNKMMEQILNNLEKEQKAREDELNSFKENIKVKMEKEQTRDERHKEQLEIAEKAIYEKDPSEKRWLKLYYVHKFVSTILKQKIEKELAKFSVVEKAFQKIKTTTGISDAQEIVNKFLSREQTYGELLSTISECEKKLEQLKRTNDVSNSKLNQLKSEVGEIMQQKNQNQNQGQIEKCFKELQIVENKAKRLEVIREKSYIWGVKTLNKIEKLLGKSTNVYARFPRDKYAELFSEIDQKLGLIILEEEDDVQDLLFEIERDQDYVDDNYTKKNIRVKATKYRKQKTQGGETTSQASNGSDLEEEQVTEDERFDDSGEQQHVYVLRDELKKKK